VIDRGGDLFAQKLPKRDRTLGGGHTTFLQIIFTVLTAAISKSRVQGEVDKGSFHPLPKCEKRSTEEKKEWDLKILDYIRHHNCQSGNGAKRA